MSAPLPISESLRKFGKRWNTTGLEAADIIDELYGALDECADKLWVLHFSLTDKIERQAAIDACNIANAALARARGETPSNGEAK